MKNIEKLTTLGIIGDIRQRLGANDENDTSKDSRINGMSSTQLIKEWCGWNIGDGGWWIQMKALYDGLERLSK